MTLYQLPAEWRAIEEALEESMGELTEEIAARIDALDATIASKVDSYYRLIANSEATLEALKAEARRLIDRAKVAERNADTFRTRLQMALSALGKQVGEKVFNADGTHYAALKENPPKVVIDEALDVQSLPESFWRVIPARWEANKKAIVDASRAGESLPDGVSVIRETSIVVK